MRARSTVIAALRRIRGAVAASGKRKVRLSRSAWDNAAVGFPNWIHAPPDHPLAAYLEAYPLYDRMLPLFAALMSEVRPDHCLVDVGANIGDTAALVRIGGGKQRIICVEASETFFALMDENVAMHRDFYGDVELVRAFVGKPGDELALEETRGTAKLVQGGGVSKVPIVSLAEVSRGSPVGIVKLDTDGFDWEIILQSMDWMKSERPSLWAEAEVNSRRGLEGWHRAISELREICVHVLAFDNFGFPLASLPLNADTHDLLGQLISYTARSGTHRRTLSYMDLCFISDRDRDVVAKFEKRIGDVLKSAGYA